MWQIKRDICISIDQSIYRRVNTDMYDISRELYPYIRCIGRNISPDGRNIKDGKKIDFFDFLSIRPVLSIIDKTFHLSTKN